MHSVDNVEEELANVSYSYDTFNNLDEIVRGDGLKYVLNYNPFHNLESIGINGKTQNLVAYSYKNGNGRLKSVTYANGHVMRASYNTLGQMVAEKWFESASSTTPIAHYKYVYDNDGNIVRTIDISAEKDYSYTYEEGKLVRSAESEITLTNEMVTAKTLLCSVIYSYDNEDNLTSKRIIFADGSEHTVFYENNEDNNPVVKFTAGGKTVTSHSKNDSFGRKEFDELQIGSGFVSRKFAYHAGEVTEEHKDGEKVKSSPTTQLVSQIVLSDGSTLSYTYDKEERITQVIYTTVNAEGETVTNTTVYTYDELGQLLTETVNGTVVNFMEYDNYGNITKKNGIDYNYDTTWKDLLVRCGDGIITYDAQGNPINYLGHNLTWEKGRQLKSFADVTYTYNANGIRTSKTVGNVTHNYTLDGTKILREEWNGNTLITLYDNEDTVCGIIYNNEPYYFQKNLQGDIIGIVNKDSEVVCNYVYDAWGVCKITNAATNCAIAVINPYRYRGYYYDEDTTLYYLQSRYYDPLTGRFINGDMPELGTVINCSIATNLFTYTKNSLIGLTDKTGFLWTFDINVRNFLPHYINSKNAIKRLERAAKLLKKDRKKARAYIKDAVRLMIRFDARKIEKLADMIINAMTLFNNPIAKKLFGVIIKKVASAFFSPILKIWNWFNGNAWYQTLVRNVVIGAVGALASAGIIALIPISLPSAVIGAIGVIVGGIVSTIYEKFFN